MFLASVCDGIQYRQGLLPECKTRITKKQFWASTFDNTLTTSARYIHSTPEHFGPCKASRSSPALLQRTPRSPRSSLPFSCLLLLFARFLVEIHRFDVVVRHFFTFLQAQQKSPVCLGWLVIWIYFQCLVKGGQGFLSSTQEGVA